MALVRKLIWINYWSFFGNYCNVLIKDRLKNNLGVQREILNDFYLGIGIFVGHSTMSSLNFFDDLKAY
jgi:hypothetical protein